MILFEPMNFCLVMKIWQFMFNFRCQNSYLAGTGTKLSAAWHLKKKFRCVFLISQFFLDGMMNLLIEKRLKNRITVITPGRGHQAIQKKIVGQYY